MYRPLCEHNISSNVLGEHGFIKDQLPYQLLFKILWLLKHCIRGWTIDRANKIADRDTPGLQLQRDDDLSNIRATELF